MKNLIDFIFFFSILFVGVFIGYMITDDINRDNARLKDEQIYTLKEEIKELTIAPAGFIMVGDTTLHVVTADPERHLHIERLTQGENFKDYSLNDHQRIEIYIFNY